MPATGRKTFTPDADSRSGPARTCPSPPLRLSTMYTRPVFGCTASDSASRAPPWYFTTYWVARTVASRSRSGSGKA